MIDETTTIPLTGYHLAWFLKNRRLRETMPGVVTSHEPFWRRWAGVPGEGWEFCEHDDPPCWRKTTLEKTENG